jgi:peptidyl-prolyl cis-trans isomerase D
MLRWLRKYSRSWFIALAIGAIVVVFIFWGVGGLKSPRFQEAAEVNGTPILLTAYFKAYNDMVRQYQEQTKGEMSEEVLKQLRLKERALNRLIEEVLILQAAERLGIRVSAPELQEQIRNYPYFQEEGRFNDKKYRLMLSRARLSVAEFEEQERRRLLIQKIMRELTSFAKVSEGELQEQFLIGWEAVAVDYLVVTPDRFMSQQNPSEAELDRYYQENQAMFRQPARVKVNYLFFQSQDYLNRVKLSQEEVGDYLKEHQEEFSRPTVIWAKQLLLTIPPKATPAQRQEVKKKAQELLEIVQAGEDFSQLAQSYSQDEASRQKGGDLGDVKKGQMPDEWEKVAFSLGQGEVGLASTSKGFHLIKVEEYKESEKLPDAEDRARQYLQEEKSLRLAREAAQQARGELSGASLAEVGKKYGVTPQETPLFALVDPIPELGTVPTFNRVALQLKPRDISRVVDLPGGFAILQGLEQQPEFLPPLEQVKEQVRQAVRRQQAKKQAEEEALRLLERLRKGEPLAQVAAQASIPVDDSDFFTRVEGFKKQHLAESLTSAAFLLSSQNPYPPRPLVYQDNYYLLAFKDRRAPDPGEFQKEREKLKNQVLEGKRRLIFEAWLTGERRRAKIKVYEMPS